MSDYISREAFKEEVRRLSTHYLNEWDTLGVLAAVDRIPAAFKDAQIGEIPAADVVEVVRCKDCKYYFKADNGYERCENSEGYDLTTEDGFCAWAKRMEES